MEDKSMEMEENREKYWVRFSYVCPHCEQATEIELLLESDADIQIFDCICCFGSLGVLTEHLEKSLTGEISKNGCYLASRSVPVFQFHDETETDADFWFSSARGDCSFLSDTESGKPGLSGFQCLN